METQTSLVGYPAGRCFGPDDLANVREGIRPNLLPKADTNQVMKRWAGKSAGSCRYRSRKGLAAETISLNTKKEGRRVLQAKRASGRGEDGTANRPAGSPQTEEYPIKRARRKKMESQISQGRESGKAKEQGGAKKKQKKIAEHEAEPLLSEFTSLACERQNEPEDSSGEYLQNAYRGITVVISDRSLTPLENSLLH